MSWAALKDRELAEVIHGVEFDSGNVDLPASGVLDAHRVNADELHANQNAYISINGEVRADHLIPKTHQQHDIGSQSSYWRSSHVQHMSVKEGIEWTPSSYHLRYVFDEANTRLTWEGGVPPNFAEYLALDVSGPTLIAPDVVPLAASTHALGTSSLRWSNVHADAIDLGGQSILYNSGDSEVVVGGIVLNTSSQRIEAGDLMPRAGSHNLGGSGDPWNSLYAGTAFFSGQVEAGDVVPAADATHSLGTHNLRYSRLHVNRLDMLDASNTEIKLSGSSRLIMQVNRTTVADGAYRVDYEDSPHVVYFRSYPSGGGSLSTLVHYELDSLRIRPRVDTLPVTGGAIDLGSASNQYDNVYTVTLIESSDSRHKNSVAPIPQSTSRALIAGLQPKSYLQANGGGIRRHSGLLAQDVRQTLLDIGLNPANEALWVQEQTDLDGNAVTDGRQGLRYTQLIAHLVGAVQDLQARVGQLEAV